MTILHSVDFFPVGGLPVAIEPRLPQSAFPEHHHEDFHEIVLVEQGAGIHIFNGEPRTLCGGCVCFVRNHDRHMYEKTEQLILTNVLYRGPEAFRFITNFQSLLPQEKNGNYPSHWRIGTRVMEQAKTLIKGLELSAEPSPMEARAEQELRFMQLLVLLRRGCSEQPGDDQDGRMRGLLDWLAEHYSEEIDWEALADKFSLSLRTLHRQLPEGEQLDLLMSAIQGQLASHFDLAEFCRQHQLSERALKQLFRQQTGMMPGQYIRQLRMCRAKFLLRSTPSLIGDVAALCGFDDSNYFSVVFTRETGLTPSAFRQQFEQHRQRKTMTL